MISPKYKFANRLFASVWFWLLLVLAVGCVVMLPIPLLGIPDGFDIPQHLRFAAAVKESILDGSVIPAWASADNYGFGSVGIRFYPLLSHYLMAATQIATDDWYDTLWMNAYIWMAVGCTGMFLWAREYLNDKWSAGVAIVYATAPYHLMQIYVYMLLAEFAATAILPFCFLYLTRLLRRGHQTDILFFSLSYSLLILTHLPTTIIATVCFGVYSLALIDFNNIWSAIRRFFVAGLLTFAATSFYVVRLFTEVNWVKHSDAQYFATGIYDYRQYLFPMIINTDERFWKKMVLLVDVPTFLTFALLVPAVVLLLVRKGNLVENVGGRKFVFALAALGVFLIFIMSLPSVFVWDNVTFLQKVQFPFRFLSVATVIGSLSFVLSLNRLISHYPKLTRPSGLFFRRGAIFGCIILADANRLAVRPS